LGKAVSVHIRLKAAWVSTDNFLPTASQLSSVETSIPKDLALAFPTSCVKELKVQRLEKLPNDDNDDQPKAEWHLNIRQSFH
jgi:hypothetical protein